MDAQIKSEWLAALRSGEYVQGDGYLRSGDDRFCCLGVLCDLMVKRGEASWERDSVFDPFIVTGGEETGNAALLPKFITNDPRFEGLNDSGDYFDKNGYRESLTSLNDNGLPFEKIAHIIEAYF